VAIFVLVNGFLFEKVFVFLALDKVASIVSTRLAFQLVKERLILTLRNYLMM